MTAVTRQTRSAARRQGSASWAVFGGLAAIILVADQLTKAWVDTSFALAAPFAPEGSAGAPTPIMGDLVRIAKTYNDGGIFGLAGDSAPVLAAASVVVIAIIVAVQARQGRGDPLLTVALGLLLGGALGNLVDRVRFGHVIDFMDTGLGGQRWYTFNVADAAISAAIVLLLVHGLFAERLGRWAGAGERPGHKGA